MKLFAAGQIVSWWYKRGRPYCVDEQLSIFIVQNRLYGQSIMASSMVVHMLQPQSNLLQVSLTQRLLERPKLFQQVFEGAVLILIWDDVSFLVKGYFSIYSQNVGMFKTNLFILLQRNQADKSVDNLPICDWIIFLLRYLGTFFRS